MDDRLRNLQRRAASGDPAAQQEYDRWMLRLYPQCSCKQERLLTLGCKCGLGPEQPIFDLETVLRGLNYRVYHQRPPNDDVFSAHGPDWMLVCNPYDHTLQAIPAGLADDYFAHYDYYDNYYVDLAVDYPYTWEDWESFLQQLSELTP